MQRLGPLILAAALALAPLGARAADLVWWQKGAYPKEDAALMEVIAAFEQESGKEVELVLYPELELPDKIVAAFEADQLPDFAFSLFELVCRRVSSSRPPAGGVLMDVHEAATVEAQQISPARRGG